MCKRARAHACGGRSHTRSLHTCHCTRDRGGIRTRDSEDVHVGANICESVEILHDMSDRGAVSSSYLLTRGLRGHG